MNRGGWSRIWRVLLLVAATGLGADTALTLPATAPILRVAPLGSWPDPVSDDYLVIRDETAVRDEWGWHAVLGLGGTFERGAPWEVWNGPVPIPAPEPPIAVDAGLTQRVFREIDEGRGVATERPPCVLLPSDNDVCVSVPSLHPLIAQAESLRMERSAERARRMQQCRRSPCMATLVEQAEETHTFDRVVLWLHAGGLVGDDSIVGATEARHAVDWIGRPVPEELIHYGARPDEFPVYRACLDDECWLSNDPVGAVRAARMLEVASSLRRES